MSNLVHFYSLNQFLRKKHGTKVIKLSLDGGFTCPNRDGKISNKGCLFCNERGSGDFAPSPTLSITSQLEKSICLLSNKWGNACKYIAYFQSYTNTYAPVEVLKQKYEEALNFPNVVGIAIATRPDCLNEEIIAYLADLSTRTHLWVELGLQTIHESSAKLINRGYPLSCYTNAVYLLANHNIEVVTHLILGLPYESQKHMLETAKFISQLPLQGVKLHMLHILDNAPLYAYYKKHPFPLLSKEEYFDIVGQILKALPPDFVIHRLTGDGNAKHLVAPLWTLPKKQVLNQMQQYFKVHNIYQGNLKNIY